MAAKETTATDSPSVPDDEPARERSRFRTYLLVVGILSLCVGGLIGRYGFPAETTPLLLRAPSQSSESGAAPLPRATPVAAAATVTPVPLQVYVSGAVNQPQVVLLPPGSLIRDALRAAGGALDEADLDSINLAAPLTNHQHILVPHRSGAAETSGATSAAQAAKIDINVAGVAELDALPAIGPTRAEDIVAYRQTHGAFSRPEDIQNVPGIGPALYEEIAPFITVSP